jgi:hypothetical protein
MELDGAKRKEIRKELFEFLQEKNPNILESDILNGVLQKSIIQKNSVNNTRMSMKTIASSIIKSDEEGYDARLGILSVFRALFNFNFIGFHIINDDVADLKLYITDTIKKDYPAEIILFIRGKNNKVFNVDNEFEIDDNLKKIKYKLDWGVFGSKEHAIVSLLCNGEPYIFDSNNIIANSDWLNGDLSGYYKKYEDVALNPIVNFHALNVFVYVKVQDDNIKNSVFSMAMVYTKQLVQLFGLPNSWSKP